MKATAITKALEKLDRFINQAIIAKTKWALSQSPTAGANHHERYDKAFGGFEAEVAKIKQGSLENAYLLELIANHADIMEHIRRSDTYIHDSIKKAMK